MDLAQKIFNNALLLKKQFEIAKQNTQTPPDVRGSIETIEVGIVEILRDADNMVTSFNCIINDHEREVKRLKAKIAKLENKPQTP
jgi:hypothetical protein